MGIKLDWQVEAERVHQRAGEDPEEKRSRRQQRLRIVFFSLGIMIAVCGIGAAIWVRLYTVDQQLKRQLIRTVQAEAQTLRVGDFGQFIAIQRTAPGGNWFQEQSERFKRYQDLKSKSTVALNGTVLDTEIDGSRGRATIEEVINGVRYETVWFYWRYSDGWRHVPSDFTFWGDPETIKGKVTTVKYNQLDAALAQTLATKAEKWWSQGCALLGCQQIPVLTLKVAAGEGDQVRWDADDPLMLIVPSPLAYGDRTPADVVIPQPLEDSIARLMAEKAFDTASSNLKPIPTADAAWLQQSTIDWLANTFTGRGDAAQVSFVQSLVEHYGSGGLTSVIKAIKPDSDISILGIALNQAIESLAVDWRTFFQWRLNIEKTLLGRNDEVGFQKLWDTSNPTALEQMRLRMGKPSQATPQVQAVTISPGADGISRATVQTTLDGQPLVIIFRLVEGGWKRSAN